MPWIDTQGISLLGVYTANDVGTAAVIPALSTMDATLLVAAVAGYPDPALGVSDSLGNVWVALAPVGPSSGGTGFGQTTVQVFYVEAPIVGPGDVFTRLPGELNRSSFLEVSLQPRTLQVQTRPLALSR